MKVWLLATGMVVLACFSFGFSPKDGKESAAMRGHMRAIYQNIAQILPIHLAQDRFYEPSEHKKVTGYLNAIAQQAELVEKLMAKSDEEHRLLSQNLVNHARSASRTYQLGALNQAYYFTEELLETCLSCHTSRKSGKDAQFASLTANINFEELGPFAKAKFLAISRQFDKAMKEYERILLKGNPSLSQIIHFDPFLQYLTLGIRVKSDKKRVKEVLTGILKKPYPDQVKQDVKHWIASLNKLGNKNYNQGTKLAQAKVLIKSGRSLMQYPRDQSGAIYFLEASYRLREYLSQKQIKSVSKAEAYLLMGKSEMVLGRPFLGPEAKHYFETSILAAPKSKVAQEAFSMYQEKPDLRLYR